MKTGLFTTPKLKTYEDLSSTWYVWFRFNGKLVKKTGDINRIQNFSKRSAAGNFLAVELHSQLKRGWNPHVPDETFNEGQDMTLYQALDYSMGKKKSSLAPKTYLDYSGTVRFCQAAIIKLKLTNLSIADTKMVHIKTILECVKASRAWSNKAYNKHLGYLQAILTELIEWQIIPFNPAHKIKTLKVPKTTANRPPTQEEALIIKSHLEQHHPEYLAFLSVLFHTGIRPWEITQLKANMITKAVYNDEIERNFVLPPEITKTDKERVVLINDDLWYYLKPILGNNCHPNHYIFARHKEGKDFTPGHVLMSRRRATDKWKRVVKDELNIDVNQYAYKHFGADMKILAGVSLEALKELYGHASTVTTEVYARAVKRVYRQELMSKSPAL